MPEGKSGAFLCHLLLEMLEKHPVNLSLDELRSLLCLVSGDGQMVSGTSNAARKRDGHGVSSQAGEFLWRAVHSPKPCAKPCATGEMSDERPLPYHASYPVELDGEIQLDDGDSAIIVCTEWDKFHRIDIALRKAVDNSPLATEVFELCGKMDAMFGGGEGQLLLRSAAEYSGAFF